MSFFSTDPSHWGRLEPWTDESKYIVFGPPAGFRSWAQYEKREFLNHHWRRIDHDNERIILEMYWGAYILPYQISQELDVDYSYVTRIIRKYKKMIQHFIDMGWTKKVPGEKKLIAENYYIKNAKQTEIAKELGLSQQSISKHLKRFKTAFMVVNV